MMLEGCRLWDSSFVFRLVDGGAERLIMMFASESTATFNDGLGSTGSRGAPCRTAPRMWSGHRAAIVARLRELAPYGAILMLPGGSLLALVLWLYRRQKGTAVLATQ